MSSGSIFTTDWLMFVNFPVKRHGVQTRQNKKRFSDIGERFDALVNFSEGEPKRVGLEPAHLLRSARGSQSAVEELGNGAVGADPTAPAEQVMNFRRDD